MRLGLCMRNVDECIRAYHVDVENDDVGEVSFTNNLNEMRNLVGTQVVSIRTADIGGRTLRIICSGEQVQNGKVSGLDGANKVVMHGNLVVTGCRTIDGEEVLSSLTEEEMRIVKDRIALVDIGASDNKYNTYVLCDMELR